MICHEVDRHAIKYAAWQFTAGTADSVVVVRGYPVSSGVLLCFLSLNHVSGWPLNATMATRVALNLMLIL